MQNRVRLLTTITTFLLITLLTLLTLTGCSNPGLTPGEGTDTDNNATGTVRFTWSDGSQAASRSRANSILDADKVVITIEAADGTVVYNQKQLNLYNFNGSFISEPLSLKVGSYKLTEYLILNSAGTVIFATPKAGSAQAHLVTMPLPHDFTVTKDGTTKVKPQVVDTAAVTPADFGYTGFTFEEAKIFNLLVSAMIYDATADSLVLTDASMDVTVATKAYSFALTNSTNNITVNDIAGNYTVTIKKAGYDDYVATYTNAEMKGFFQTPLTVMLSKKVNTAVTFVDPNLETVVRQAIGKPAGEISSADVAGLTTLKANLKKISSLNGIEKLTSLTSLVLNGNTITDITPLAKLTNLTTLDINSNKISDLSPLSPLTKLTTLNLNFNTLTDLTPLSSLTSLTTLQLTMTGITDIAPLSSLTNLTTLYLNRNSLTDISSLGALTGLNELHLTSNSIQDISSLSTLTKVTKLYIGENQISNIAALAPLTTLVNLQFGYNQVVDLAPLTGLVNLQTLAFTSNSVTDLSPLVNNTGIGTGDTLTLQSNPLSADAKSVQVPAIRARGAQVTY